VTRTGIRQALLRKPCGALRHSRCAAKSAAKGPPGLSLIADYLRLGSIPVLAFILFLKLPQKEKSYASA